MFEIVEQQNSLTARIKVIGIGGGGSNAVNTMIGRQSFWRRFHGGEYRRAIPGCERGGGADSTRRNGDQRLGRGRQS